MASCTTLDHVYPANAGIRTADGTPCYCGKRRWNQDAASYRGPTASPKPARLPRKHQLVRLVIDGLDTLWSVDEVDRETNMFHVEGKGWHEPSEVLR